MAPTAADVLIEAIQDRGVEVIPDDSPYTTGSIGLLGTKPSQEALEECDTLLIVGSSFPYIEFLPKPRSGPRRADRARSQAEDRARVSRVRAGGG